MKQKLLFFLKHWEELIAAAALTLMTATAVMNVVTRYVFSHPFTWAEELQCICLTWAAFLSAAVGYKENLHFGLDFIVDRMGRLKPVIRRVITFIGIFLFAYLCYLSVGFMLSTTKYTIFFRLHYAYIFLAPALGFFSMTIWSMIYFVESFRFPERYDRRYTNNFDEDMEGKEELQQ